jgi:hypothetical protein
MKFMKSGISGINASPISLLSKHNLERKTRQAQDIIRQKNKTCEPVELS